MKVVMETGPFYLIPALSLPTPPPFLLLNSYFVSLSPLTLWFSFPIFFPLTSMRTGFCLLGTVGLSNP